MAKKRTALGQTLFRDIDPYSQSDDNRGGAQSLPLDSVRPDPGQPRRLLPEDLAGAVSSGRLAPAQAIRQWLERPEAGRGQRRRELRRLADSIASQGLINPITVRRSLPDEVVAAGVEYLIVTGERRYWAFALLLFEGRVITAGDETLHPTHIPALVSSSGITIRAHQLVENLHREDINAVEKARGLWALRYELSGMSSSPQPDKTGDEVNHGSPPPIGAGEVNHGSPALVPWSQVSDLLGISQRYRIYLTSVLDLAPEALAIVADHSLAERAIRPVVQRLKERPDLQVEALQQLVTWQQASTDADTPGAPSTKAVQALVESLLRREAAAGKRPRPLELSPNTKRFRSKVRGALRFLDRLEKRELTLVARDLALDAEYEGVARELEELRQQLDYILTQVGNYHSGEQD